MALLYRPRRSKVGDGQSRGRCASSVPSATFFLPLLSSVISLRLEQMASSSINGLGYTASQSQAGGAAVTAVASTSASSSACADGETLPVTVEFGSGHLSLARIQLETAP